MCQGVNNTVTRLVVYVKGIWVVNRALQTSCNSKVLLDFKNQGVIDKSQTIFSQTNNRKSLCRIPLMTSLRGCERCTL